MSFQFNLFTRPGAVELAQANRATFTDEFLEYLPANLHVYEAFRRETLRVIARGFKHYSARTIIEVLRHNSALEQVGGPWKLNDHNTPYLARLFDLEYPEHIGLFVYRATKAVERDQETA